MTWPLLLDSDTHSFSWMPTYAPRLLFDIPMTIKELYQLLQDHEPNFPQRISRMDLPKVPPRRLYRLWFALMILVIPLLWTLIILRISQQFLTNISAVAGLELTLVLILLLGVILAGVGLYGRYRKIQTRMDLFEQLDLLHYHIKDSESPLSDLESILEERNGKIYWKKYYLGWELSNLFPTLTLLDIFAIFGSIFGQIFILVWLFRILRIVFSDFGADTYLIGLEMIFIPTFLFFMWLGVKIGRSQQLPLNFKSPELSRVLKLHLLSLGIAIVLVLLFDLIRGQLSPVFLILFLFGQIPVLTAFSFSSFAYLRKYIRIRTALARQLQFLRIMDSTDDQTSSRYLVNESITSLNTQSLLPTSRLRSYVLILTAVVSLMVPIITAFLSSIDRFSDILRLLFPS